MLKARRADGRPDLMAEGESSMAGPKEAYTIELNPDQMAFIRQAKAKYN